MPDSRPEVEGRVETRTRLYLTPQHGFSGWCCHFHEYVIDAPNPMRPRELGPRSTGPVEHWGPPTRGKQPPVQWGLFLNSALRLSWAQQGWGDSPSPPS